MKPRFVAVEYRRDPWERELQHRREIQFFLCFFVFAVGKFVSELVRFRPAVRAYVRQRVDNPYRVVRAQAVHQTIYRFFRIIFKNGLYGVFEKLFVAVANVCDNRVHKRIIHRAVQLIAEKIRPKFAVTYFRRRVFPDFADDQSVLVHRFDFFDKQIYEINRQFVHDVESPPVRAEFLPLFDDAVFAEHESAVILIAFVKVGHVVAAPPASVFVGEFFEIIPVVIRRRFALIRPERVVRAEFIEV